MQKKTILITSGAIAAALVLGGVGVAVADPFDDTRDAVSTTDSGSASGANYSAQGFDDDLTGTDLERASAAALLAAGDGTVTDAESSGSSNHAFEVDVRLDDGTEVEVYLDSDFAPLKVESSDDLGDDHRGDHGDDNDDDRSGANRGGDDD